MKSRLSFLPMLCLVVVGFAVATTSGCSKYRGPSPEDGTAVDKSPEAVTRTAELLSPTKTPMADLRRLAADELKKKGKAAMSAVPALEKAAASDPDANVKKAAKEAADAIKAATE